MANLQLIRNLTCKEYDGLLCGDNNRPDIARWGVHSALTDPDGEYGPPKTLLRWYERAEESHVIEGIRFPKLGGGRPDREPCRHREYREVSEDD